MITIAYITNTTFDTDNFREVAVVRLGGDDAQTADEVSPWGVDSNPVKDISAAFTESLEKGATVTLGYFIKDKKALPGETRLFATDANGAEKTRVWLHADGTVELGGTGDAGSNTKHVTQYEALNTELQAVITKLNAQLTLIQTGITGVGGTYARVDVTGNFTSAKLTNIKTE